MKIAMLPTLLSTAAAVKQGRPIDNGTNNTNNTNAMPPIKEPDNADVCRVVADFSIKDMREAASNFNLTATTAMSKMNASESGSEIELLSSINSLFLNKTDTDELKGRIGQAESKYKSTRQSAVTEFAKDYATLAFTDNFVLKPLASVLDEPISSEHGEALTKSSERIKNDSFNLMSASACIAEHAARQ